MYSKTPKANASQNSNSKQSDTSARSTKDNKDVIVFVYDGQRVLSQRPTSYQAAVKAAARLFPLIARDPSLTLHTRDLKVCRGQLAKIDSETWQYICDELEVVEVTSPQTERERYYDRD